jgi:hypothetical protein
MFILKSALLIAVTVGLYWLGWRSPWARADDRVKVEVVDGAVESK